MNNTPQELNETTFVVIGGLALVLGGSVLLLQVPAVRETVRPVLQDSEVHKVCREGVTRVGREIIASMLRQVGTVALPPSAE